VENDVIKMFAEAIYNILHGNVRLPREKKQQLLRHKQLLRNLSSSTISLANKRSLLQQQSGGSLFSVLLPIISSAVGRLL